MRTLSIDTFFVQANPYLEILPAWGLVELFTKHVYIPFIAKGDIAHSRFLTHLKERNSWHMLFVALPLGILVVKVVQLYRQPAAKKKVDSEEDFSWRRPKEVNVQKRRAHLPHRPD